jgi:hypothetical protein
MLARPSKQHGERNDEVPGDKSAESEHWCSSEYFVSIRVPGWSQQSGHHSSPDAPKVRFTRSYITDGRNMSSAYSTGHPSAG